MIRCNTYEYYVTAYRYKKIKSPAYMMCIVLLICHAGY
jgi:hypothetical protein